MKRIMSSWRVVNGHGVADLDQKGCCVSNGRCWEELRKETNISAEGDCFLRTLPRMCWEGPGAPCGSLDPGPSSLFYPSTSRGCGGQSQTPGYSRLWTPVPSPSPTSHLSPQKLGEGGVTGRLGHSYLFKAPVVVIALDKAIWKFWWQDHELSVKTSGSRGSQRMMSQPLGTEALA